MELAQKERSAVDIGVYRTPLQKLAKRFKGSVELWKEKYQELRRAVKRFRNRAADARRSRDHWKEQAGQWKAQVAELEAELARWREPGAAGDQEPAQKRGPK